MSSVLCFQWLTLSDFILSYIANYMVTISTLNFEVESQDVLLSCNWISDSIPGQLQKSQLVYSSGLYLQVTCTCNHTRVTFGLTLQGGLWGQGDVRKATTNRYSLIRFYCPFKYIKEDTGHYKLDVSSMTLSRSKTDIQHYKYCLNVTNIQMHEQSTSLALLPERQCLET